ncbi:MAG: hypothetical protein IJZ20_00300, partial [Clostridia bacterium]|nr:hypothetical protein [Clostridia bacterium]
EGVSGVRYITQISFLLDAKRDTYSLALAVDSNVVGAQLGGETDNPVTLSIDWSLFSAPIYSESEYTEKITAKRPFSGHLDGNGYALKNITINTSERLVGVFGYGYNASVENLRIENISINAKRDYTINIGGLFGCFEGNWQADDIHITGCHIDGKITADGEKNVFTGGLVGAHKVNLNAAVVKDCRVDVDIVSVAGTTSYVGGMIGTIETGIDLSQCVVTGSAYGEAEGDANPYTGGISARLVYDDWIGTTLGVEDAVLMAEQGYSIAARLVSSIQVQSVSVYRPLIGNTFSKVLGGAEASNCYYDAQHAVTGTLDSHAGIEKTKAELFDKAFLSNTIGLDFDNTWTMVLGVPELISKEPYIAYEYEGTSFNIQPVNCGNCTVYAAAYDTYGRMLEARIAPFTEGNPVTVSFDGAAFKTVKFFALGEGNSPICESESYTAE